MVSAESKDMKGEKFYGYVDLQPFRFNHGHEVLVFDAMTPKVANIPVVHLQ